MGSAPTRTLLLAALIGTAAAVAVSTCGTDRDAEIAPTPPVDDGSARPAEQAPPPRHVTEEELMPEESPASGCGLERPGPHDRASGTAATGAVGFGLKFGDEVSTLQLMSAFVMPGERLTLEAVLEDRGHEFTAAVDGGTLERLGPARWQWTAPGAPGILQLHVSDDTAGEVTCLNLFVLAPYDGQEVFNGYRIGRYERIPLRSDPAYDMPRGLVEVHEEDLETSVSPHFQLRQFLCKQPGGFPKYLVLRTRLLLKLEKLLELFNANGVEASTFAILSGYRTPWYNASIGNTTRYSRHAYGDAADIYVDRDGDGRMDDLDGDGEITRADAALLHRLVEDAVDRSWYRPFVGGLGLYGPRPHRGPFIHVDTRGFRARW